MAEVDDLRREMADQPPRGEQPKTRVKRERSKRDTSRTQYPTRNKQPRASERSSVVAQDWYDRGTARGYTFPYDVNYLALGIQKRVESDPRMTKYLAKGRADDVARWLERMVSNWWDFYADEDITQSNAKDYFLGTDWEDLRDWALENLKSEYAVKHGKRVPPPIYPDQQAYQQRLEDLRKKHSVESYIKRLEDEPEAEPLKVDDEARERLRSWRDRHKQARREREQGR